MFREYEVVVGRSVVALDAAVSKKLEDGWEPWGSMVYAPPINLDAAVKASKSPAFMQPMVRR